MTAIPDRKIVLDLCRQGQEARKLEYGRELENLDEAAAAESKSSAGDKYETGREMIAQSRVVIERNLAETKASLEAIERMAAAPLRAKVLFGSMVETTLGWYLVGASLGELEADGIVVRTISLASPLGSALKGKGVGDSIPWRGSAIEVLQIPC